MRMGPRGRGTINPSRSFPNFHIMGGGVSNFMSAGIFAVFSAFPSRLIMKVFLKDIVRFGGYVSLQMLLWSQLCSHFIPILMSWR